MEPSGGGGYVSIIGGNGSQSFGSGSDSAVSNSGGYQSIIPAVPESSTPVSLGSLNSDFQNRGLTMNYSPPGVPNLDILPGQTNLSPQQIAQANNPASGGNPSTLSQGNQNTPSNSIWDNIGSFLNNAKNSVVDKLGLGDVGINGQSIPASSENPNVNQIASDQNAYQAVKNYDTITPQITSEAQGNGVTPTDQALIDYSNPGGSLLKNSPMEDFSRSVGLRTDLTNSEFTNYMMTLGMGLGLTTAPIETAKGIASFTAVNKIKSGLVSALQGNGFDLSSNQNISDLLPSDTNPTIKNTVDVLDFLTSGAIAGKASGFMDRPTDFVKQTAQAVIDKYNLPDQVTVTPQDLKLTPSESTDAASNLGVSKATWDGAKAYGETVTVPTENLVTIADKGYWNQVKANVIDNGSQFKYTPADNLSPEGRGVESSFANKIANNLDGAITEYKSRFGNVLSADNAKELSSEYNISNESRAKYASAVHEPASALVKTMYERALKEPIVGDRRGVLITAGGGGAGKTTALSDLPGMQQLKDQAKIVYDTTFSHTESARRIIDQALETGHRVSVAYVDRNPVDAFVNGVLPRAERTGRTVPIDSFISSHVGAQITVLDMAKEYASNKDVGFIGIDNNQGKGNAKYTTLDTMRANEYNKTELKDQILKALEHEHQTGKINDAVYNAEKASAETHGPNGSGTLRENNDSQSQPQRDVGTAPTERSGKVITDKESELHSAYAKVDKSTLEEHLYNIWQELDASEAGTRSFTQDGDGNTVITGKSSSFPQWIPEELRQANLVTAVKESIMNGVENLKYPDGNRSAQRALLNSVLDELDRRSGVDTSKVRSDILVEYDKPANVASKTSGNAESVRSSTPGGEGKPNGNRTTGAKLEYPVGEGAAKESQFYTKLKSAVAKDAQNLPPELLDEVNKIKSNGQTLNLKEGLDTATKYATDNYNEARSVALGLKAMPKDLNTTHTFVGLATAHAAALRGDFQTAGDIWARTGLHGFRAGQEIVSFRGAMNDNSPQNFIKQLISDRMTHVTDQYSSRINDLGLKKASPSKQADALIRDQAHRATLDVTDKIVNKKTLQDIIEELKCK